MVRKEDVIEILGVEYGLGAFSSHARDDGSMGRCDEKKGSIVVAEDMPPGVRESTLLHEIVHAVSGMLQVGLNEKQVGALSAGLFTVRHNGKRMWRGVEYGK